MASAPLVAPLAARVRAPAAWRPTLGDLAVVAAVAVPTTMDAWWNSAGTRQADGLTYALLVAQLAVLLWRRRFPLAVTLACALGATTWAVLGHQGEALTLPTLVGLYTVAAEGDRRRTLVVGVAAALYAGVLAEATADPVGSPMLEMAWPVVALLVGEVVRGRRELAAEYAARAAGAAAEREAESRRRVQEERLRIARDLHDVVAHTLVAVNVQTAVAAEALARRPEAAGKALARARTSTRDALAELRAAVAVLRDPDGTRPTSPPPGLAQIAELVAASQAGGLAVTLDDRASAGPRGDEGDTSVPPAIGLAAYRIVQEALANVARHARARTAVVTLDQAGDALVVEVVDDGVGPPPGPAAAAAAGFGLVGMRERAAALGGTVEVGRAAGTPTGFRVSARLPLARPPAGEAGRP